MAAFALITPSQAEPPLHRPMGPGWETGGDGLRGGRCQPKARLLRAGGWYLPGLPAGSTPTPCLRCQASRQRSLGRFHLIPLPGASAERGRFCAQRGWWG